MKLTRVEIAHWRQFGEPFALDELQPGINLFTGPNEAGKSTLVEAIRAAFFERYKSGSVKHFQPWGDSGAEPSVALEFNWQDERWKLAKRFLGHQRCDLDIDGRKLNGDEAEERLAGFMGYSFAGRGASRPELHGIPGLLWVEQGTIQEVDKPAEYAGDYLQKALGQDLDSVTSSSGDWLLARVSELRAELLTKTGKTTGEFKKTEDDLARSGDELDKLNQQLASYEGKVDELARLQVERDQIDACKPWEAQRQRAREMQARLDDINRLVEQQDQARRELGDCVRQLELLQDRLRNFEDQGRQLAERDQARTAAQNALNRLLANGEAIDASQHKAKESLQAAEQFFRQAREQAHRQRLENTRIELQKSLQLHRQTLATLREQQQELRNRREQRQQKAIDPQKLESLRRLQKQLDALHLRKEVAATRLAWQLELGKAITIEGEELGGTGERLLLQTASITIAGLGSLHITPGGKDAGQLAQDEGRLVADRASLLAELGVQDLVEADARAEECGRLDREIEFLTQRLQDRAPQGVDTFVDQMRDNELQLESLNGQLRSGAPMQEGVPAEDEAERERDSADEAFKAADEALRNHREQLARARQAHDNANEEWQRLRASIDNPDRQQTQLETSRNLVEQERRQAKLQSELDQRQKEIDTANPDVLKNDVERFENSARAMEEAARRREEGIKLLLRELEVLGAHDLEEQRDGLQQSVEALRRRHAQLGARAHALDHLLGLLQEQRRLLTLRLQAPLQKHLTHYLNLLFPGASIAVDENLIPRVLQRDGAHGDLADLSYGAREQLGLVSRLAYADLLQEANKPTLIILDDALVHSDSDRLDRMKRILYDAAKRHQVLLFSCHPEKWIDLGVPARDLQRMKTSIA